jgi:hypothetical protein
MTGGRDGFKMVIHGGQSGDSSGLNPVVSDTWRLDLSTMVWTSYPSDPLAPAVSHAYVMPITNSTVMLYGGKTAANDVFGRTMTMHVAQGWRSVLPAGPRPEPRTGHVVTYDPLKYAMTVSHGINFKGDLLNDTWVLHLSGTLGKWVCTHGDGPDCSQSAAFANASDSPPQRPPPLAGAAFATSASSLFVFGGLISGSNERKVISDEFWRMSLSTDTWKRVLPDMVTTKHSFPIEDDPEKYERWNFSAVPDKDFKKEVKPPERHQAAAAIIGPMADMQRPLLVVGGSRTAPGEAPNKTSLLDDIWIIDTGEPSAHGSLLNGMLTFDGIDDIVSIPLPAWVGTTRSMNGMWIEAWIQQKSIYESVILWDAMMGDTVVLRAMLTTVGGSQFARLVYYPGKAQQINIKTWGPIVTEGFASAWHHIAFVMRFAHVSRGSAADPDAILTQAFFFVDCEPQKDDGTFLLLNLRELALSSGFDFMYVGGASSRASIQAKEGYNWFNGNMDNIRIWWVLCPPGPTKCNPYGFLYPQQDYAPYKRMPASQIHDEDVTVDDVAPILRNSMFTDQMPTNTTDLLVSIEVDHQDEGGVLIDTSMWLPKSCMMNKEKSTGCPGCPEACFFDDCWKFDADCFEPRLSQETVSFYAENGTCRCLDSMACPTYAEKCQCPAGFDRSCSQKNTQGACIAWECICGGRKSTECSLCMLNGNLQKPADPCLPPGTCRRSSCVFPFAKLYDTARKTESDPADINSLLETIEIAQFATDMVGRYLDPGVYEKTKEHILNIMEFACYAFFDFGALVIEEVDYYDRFLKPPANLGEKQDDKRCNDPAKYASDDLQARCKCTFEHSTVTEQTSLRKKIDQYWKSGASSYDRTSEALSQAPQMYNLTLALALICKAGRCMENKWGQESSYCPPNKIDPAVFMEHLVGDKDKDNKLSETEFLDQYKVLSRLRAVTWDLDPMKCTAGASECDNMCQSSSPNVEDSTCKCKRIKSTQTWDLSEFNWGDYTEEVEPLEGTCVFANLEEEWSGELICANTDYLLPPAAFFMHLTTNGAQSPALGFVTAQRLFDVGLVTKLFGAKFDKDGSDSIDMWELHCFYLEERDKRNSCYQDVSEGYGTGLRQCAPKIM